MLCLGLGGRAGGKIRNGLTDVYMQSDFGYSSNMSKECPIQYVVVRLISNQLLETFDVVVPRSSANSTNQV